MNHTLLDHPAAVALLAFLVVGGLCSPAGATRIPVEPIWPAGCSSDMTPHSPMVRVNASHQWGIVPFDVEFGIELAVDDSVLSVAWDFDGDGLEDTSGTEARWTFSDAVDYEVRARVSTQRHGVLGGSTSISGHSALMSVTFDDGQMTVRTVAYSILEARGLTATAYIVPTWLNGAWYMWWNDLDFLQDHGWDIGSHTMTHPDLTKVDSTTLHYELSQSRAELQARGFPAKHLAVPYGACNWTVIDAARLYYDSCRGWKGLNPRLEDTDPYLLRWDVTARTKPLSAYTTVMDSVITYGGWYILNNHIVYEDCGGVSTCVTSQMFADILDYALGHRIKILNVDEALSLMETGLPGFPPVQPGRRLAGGEAHLSVKQDPALGPPALIHLSLPAAARADLAIYDVRGRRVRSLAVVPAGSGEYSATWDGRDQSGARVSSGIYFCVLNAANISFVTARIPVVR